MVLLPAAPGLATEEHGCKALSDASAQTAPALEYTTLRSNSGGTSDAQRYVKHVSVVPARTTVGVADKVALVSPASPSALRTRIPQRGPLTFVENRGQFDRPVRFAVQRGHDAIWLTADSIVFGLARMRAPKTLVAISAEHGAQNLTADRAVFSERIAGPHPALTVYPQVEQQGKYNFMLGANHSRWRSGIKGYALVTYRNAWPGVDLRLRGKDQDLLEHAFVVQPGGDPNVIRMDFSGVKSLRLSDDGSLAIETALGHLHESRPLAYQTIDGKRAAVRVSFKLAGDGYAFNVGRYDRRWPLIIDPALLYSTYLGGVHDDSGNAIAVDAAGNAYVLGITASQNFPVTANAYQTVRSNIGTYTYDIFVTKVSPSGTLLYSTFVGGSADDLAFSIKVDATGSAYFVGQTLSSDYPTTPGAYQTSFNNCVDGLVTKLSPDGSTLVYSTYLGGSNKIGCGEDEFGDNLVEGLALDKAGNAFIVGGTGSPDFPVTPGAYETKYPGGTNPTDVFLAGYAAELSATGAHLIYSTFLGRNNASNNGVTLAKSVALDSAGDAAIVGLSDSFPTTPGAFQASSLGGFDAFAIKLDPTGSHLECSTLLGGSGYDDGYDVLLDSSDNFYVAGRTDSADFPVTAGAYVTKNPGSSQVFVARLSADCRTLAWASEVEQFQPNPGSLGQFFDLGGVGFVIDPASGDLFVASDTADQKLATTPDAAQKSFGGGTYDGFLMELDADAANVLYATYFGGTGDDGINAIALDTQGNVYMTGATTSASGFPLTSNAFQSTFGGTTGQPVDGHDAFFATIGNGTAGSVYPGNGGNTGSVTLTVTGAGFAPDATATLSNGSTSISAGVTSVSSDGARIAAIFELAGAAPGSYKVTVANPGGATFTSASPFTIVSGGGPSVWTNISGRSAMRLGTPTPIQVVIGNSGINDAYGTIVLVTLPSQFSVKLGFAPTLPATLPGELSFDPTQVPILVTQGGTTMIPLEIPLIPAGGSIALPIELTGTTSGDTSIEAMWGNPWFQSLTAAQQFWAAKLNSSPPLQVMSGMLATASVEETQETPASKMQVGNCISGILQIILNVLSGNSILRAGLGVQQYSKLLYTSFVLQQQTQYAQNAIKGALPSITGVFAGSAVNFGSGNPPPSALSALTQAGAAIAMLAAGAAGAAALPEAAAIAAGIGVGLSLADFINSGALSDCIDSAGTLITAIVSAIDPNDKTGPHGALKAHWVLGSQPLSYTVSFENEPAATAPAQQVVITDRLDPTRFDLTTVQLGPMGFGKIVVTPPSGSSNFSITVDLGAVASVADLKVDIQGSLDRGTGLLKWTFRSIDASTGLPPDDPLAGFLPPNTASVAPSGAGAVAFSVRPRGRLANGSTVKNQASVVFDTNAAIKTPVWRNTLAQPVAGALSISPDPLNFGSSPVFGTSGASRVSTIVLSNPSTQPILVGGISTTSDFQLVNQQACHTLLLPGQNCTLGIKFVPGAVANYSGRLIVVDSSANAPQIGGLEGSGVAGRLTFDPDSLSFGKVAVNTTSSPKKLKMVNATGATATVVSLALAAGTEFVLSNDLCTGTNLTRGQDCTVEVAFSPVAAGHQTAELTVTTDSTKSQKVALGGTGVP